MFWAKVPRRAASPPGGGQRAARCLPQMAAGRALLALGLLVGGLACSRWTAVPKQPVELLHAPEASRESCSLEIFFARFPFGQEDLNEPLWRQIDEQSLPASLREPLARNGFRAGLISGNLPAALVRVLKLQNAVPQVAAELEPKALELAPTIRRRLVQLGPESRVQVAESGIYDQLPLLWYRRGHLQGESFAKAQCIFALTAAGQGDGRVRLKLVPEIQHGDPRQTITTADGFFRIDVARPKQLFDELAISVVLSAGQMLLVGTMPDRPGSIGQQFFTGPSGDGREQKLLLVRLVRPPPPEWLAARP